MPPSSSSFLCWFCCGLAISLAAEAAETLPAWQSPPKLAARTYNSGFADAHDTYNGMGCASDGKIYYVLCADKYDVGARMYCFDPATERNRQFVGDITEACGEAGKHSIVQGKSHVNFVETEGNSFSPRTSATTATWTAWKRWAFRLRVGRRIRAAICFHTT